MIVLPYQLARPEQIFETENYVSSPPALWIIDETGANWTLGFNRGNEKEAPRGEFCFDVLRDGVRVLEAASRIERRNRKIRCFTREGWKTWTGISFF